MFVNLDTDTYIERAQASARYAYEISAGRKCSGDNIKRSRLDTLGWRFEMCRYATAWVEYIDLSRSRPPRSHRRHHRYHPIRLLLSGFLVVASNCAHPTLSSIVRVLIPSLPLCRLPSPSCTSTAIHLHIGAFCSYDIRGGGRHYYCLWYWRCRPCYARTWRIDPRGDISISTFADVSDIMLRDETLFCSGISSRDFLYPRITVTNANLIYVKFHRTTSSNTARIDIQHF